MKKNLTLLLASLLTSTCLLASLGEEDPTNLKRAMDRLGVEDDATHKKQRAGSGEAEETSYWGNLPADALRAVGDYLDDRDLSSLSRVKKAFRHTLQPQLLLRKVPARIWLSGLAFDSSAESQKAWLTFVGEIMPDVMDTLLLLYKDQAPKAGAQLQRLLAQHGTMASQGKTLETTPLWQFLRGLKGTDPKDVNPEDFHKEGPLGDGDRMFLNLLHYINSDFKVSPARLPGFVVQKDPRRASPQARMHVASLKGQVRGRVNDLASAKILDDILELFDDLRTLEAFYVSNTYRRAGKNSQDSTQQIAHFLKGAQLAQKHYWGSEMPDLSCLKMAARCYFGAATAASTPESVSTLWEKSAHIHGHLLAITNNPENTQLRRAALSYERASRCIADPAAQKAYIQESLRWWNAYGVSGGEATPQICGHMARAFVQAAFLELGSSKSDAHFLLSAQLWNIHIPLTQDLGHVTTGDLYQAARANQEAVWGLREGEDKVGFLRQSTRFWNAWLTRPDADLNTFLHQAAIAFNNLSSYTQNADKRISAISHSVSLWEQYLTLLPTPSASILECASKAFINGINIKDIEASDIFYNRYVAFLDRYVADPENLDAQVLVKVAGLYMELANKTKSDAQKTALFAKTAALCDVVEQKKRQPIEQ